MQDSSAFQYLAIDTIHESTTKAKPKSKAKAPAESRSTAQKKIA